MSDDGKRIYARQQVAKQNTQLFQTAKAAGVSDFVAFNNAGYLGLYGMDAAGIASRKKLGKDQVLDRAGTTELAANLFRITQTDEKLKRESVRGEPSARRTHFEVGKKVRDTMQ